MIQTRAWPHAQHLAGDSREDEWRGKHEALLAAAESRGEGRKATAGAAERRGVKDPGQGTEIINGFLHPQHASKCFMSRCHSSESNIPRRAQRFVQGEQSAESVLFQHLPAESGLGQGRSGGRPQLEAAAICKKPHNLLSTYFFHFTLL